MMKIKREDHSFKKIVLTLESQNEADELWLRLFIRPSMIDAAYDGDAKLKSDEASSSDMFNKFDNIYTHTKINTNTKIKKLKESRV